MRAGTSIPAGSRIVDVGGELLVIRTTDFPGPSPLRARQGVAPDPTRHAADQVEMQAIVDSIQLDVREAVARVSTSAPDARHLAGRQSRQRGRRGWYGTATMGADLRDPVVRTAVGSSHLAGVPEPLLAPLLDDAVWLRVPAGSHVRREGEPGAHLELVISGLVRIFVSSPDGRTLTVRYCRPGALIGVVSLFRPSYVMPGGMQALVDSELLVLRAEAVRSASAVQLAIASALIAELSERVYQFVVEIPGASFATVRQRVARHLLDLAAEQQQGTRLVAPISQQALADAVGSVREVVVRTLGELRREGLVATGAGGIRILDPDRLAGDVFPPAVTEVPRLGDRGR